MSLPTLLNTRSPLAPPAAQRARLDALPLARTFREAAASAGHEPLRPVAPSSWIPAISSPKRTQRVQWMQRVMSVETSGPRFLSLTTRFFSV